MCVCVNFSLGQIKSAEATLSLTEMTDATAASLSAVLGRWLGGAVDPGGETDVCVLLSDSRSATQGPELQASLARRRNRVEPCSRAGVPRRQ